MFYFDIGNHEVIFIVKIIRETDHHRSIQYTFKVQVKCRDPVAKIAGKESSITCIIPCKLP